MLAKVHLKSLFFGISLTLIFNMIGNSYDAAAIDLKSVGNIGKKIKTSIIQLGSVKKNLDSDIKKLKKDAKILMGDKDKLMAIKNQLVALAKQTKSQIDSIQKLVGVVEGHIKTTQTDIQTTAGHVYQVDQIRKDLGKF
tara:strand:- start:1146 stop:1562 length:417 start_codon:yes stop_codon:yes gene_type:complete